MRKDNCDRCGQPTNGSTIMSAFNLDVICLTCKAIERKHPSYNSAVETEHAEIKKGNYNYEGVGLPEDLKPKKEIA